MVVDLLIAPLLQSVFMECSFKHVFGEGRFCDTAAAVFCLDAEEELLLRGRAKSKWCIASLTCMDLLL